MNTEEQQLISQLFDRMESAAPPAKDYEAERLIQERTRRFPDAPYMMVQTVVVQEHALQQAGARVRQLEDLVASLQRNGVRPSEGSFLGGAQSISPWTRTSVPETGYDRGPSQYSSAPVQSAPQPQSMSQPAAPAASQGGGFLASALSTASGVAGGVLLADGLRSLLGGSSSMGTGSLFGGIPGMPRGSNDSAYGAQLDRARDDAQDARDDADDARRELAEDDAALDDAQDQLDDQDDQDDDDTMDV